MPLVFEASKDKSLELIGLLCDLYSKMFQRSVLKLQFQHQTDDDGRNVFEEAI